MIRLGVNIDHVATIRNARGGDHPDPVEAAMLAIAAGADGITAHLREDRRHMRDADIDRLRATITRPLNLEMAATPEMLAVALRVRPNAACVVPENRAEITTEGGLDVAGHFALLRPMVAALRDGGIRVSLFVDPNAVQLQASRELGADIVELHTGAYAHGELGALDRLASAAAEAERLGLECHAGHGLSYANVAAVAALPQIVELNIGHFIIGQAIFEGLPAVLARMRVTMDAARPTLA